MPIQPSLPFERTRARILRVNHAGERGAIAIYAAQLRFAPFLPSETGAFLRHAIAHEREHEAKFRKAMQQRGVKPMPAIGVWSVGGFVPGLMSLLGGRRGVMACTAAIEDVVHGHLDEQIDFLRGRDDVLADIIRAILVEEIEHKEVGLSGFNPACKSASAFTGFVSVVTEALIWLATFGDAARLRRAAL